MITHRFVGCDIGRDHLDLFDPGVGRGARIANAPEAVGRWVAGLAGGQAFVVMEATGRHDRLVRHALAGAGVSFARVNPAPASTRSGLGALPRRGDGWPRPTGSTRGL